MMKLSVFTVATPDLNAEELASAAAAAGLMELSGDSVEFLKMLCLKSLLTGEIIDAP